MRVEVHTAASAFQDLRAEWQHTRRTDPARVARHWLVLAVAMLWVLAYGTRAEDAAQQDVPPARLVPPPSAPPPAAGQCLSPGGARLAADVGVGLSVAAALAGARALARATTQPADYLSYWPLKGDRTFLPTPVSCQPGEGE